jgi:arsenite oxidase small subunit
MSPKKANNDKPNDNQPNARKRNFLKVAVTFSSLLLIGGIAAITKAITNPAPPATTGPVAFPKVKVASIGALIVNEPVVFNYPLDNEPNILVKLGQKANGGIGPDGDIVAFSALCQHLGCIYSFQSSGTSPQCNSSFKADAPLGYCCCHGSVFDFLHSANVRSGPSPRPQPQVILQLDDSGEIFAVGMSPPTIFGHNTGSNDVAADLQGGNPVS